MAEAKRSNGRNVTSESYDKDNSKTSAFNMVHKLHSNWMSNHRKTLGHNTQRTRAGKNISQPTTGMQSMMTDNRPTQSSKVSAIANSKTYLTNTMNGESTGLSSNT